MFTIIEDSFAILRNKGVYRQAKLYSYKDILFAAHGNGFIFLRKDNGTSIPGISWEELIITFTPEIGKFGKLMIPEKA